MSKHSFISWVCICLKKHLDHVWETRDGHCTDLSLSLSHVGITGLNSLVVTVFLKKKNQRMCFSQTTILDLVVHIMQKQSRRVTPWEKKEISKEQQQKWVDCVYTNRWFCNSFENPTLPKTRKEIKTHTVSAGTFFKVLAGQTEKPTLPAQCCFLLR